MQTRTLYSIVFFKDVICKLTDFCIYWFPLVDLCSCEVTGNLQYRHIMLSIYTTESDYINYNLRYKEVSSNNVNTFKIRWVRPDDEEERVIIDTILNEDFFLFFQMQTRTLYSIMFFKDVINDSTRYCRTWFSISRFTVV